MTKSHSILTQLQTLHDTLNTLKVEMREHLSDQSIPLAERWNLFINLPKDCYEKSFYGPSFSNMGDLVLYDGFIHAERYETINVIDMISRIETAKQDIDSQAPHFQKDLKRVDVDLLKEEAMKKMLGSFVFDW